MDNGANTLVNSHTFPGSFGAKGLAGVMHEFRLEVACASREQLARLHTEDGQPLGVACGLYIPLKHREAHMVCRRMDIRTGPHAFEELGLEKHIQELLYLPRGLILVTGPTGSGKTTTLATMIDHVNRNRRVHILTIEDPIEYRHQHQKSVVSQRELGSDVPSFSEALRRALRETPDVILVGEMRDLESTRLAITAAETGHLVLATVHTRSAQATVERIIDEFPANQQAQIRTQLASSLVAVLSQTLIPKLGGKGLVAGYEILIVNSAVRNLIRENKTFRIDSTIQTSRDKGMKLLDDSLLELYERGLIERTEVLTRSRYLDTVTERLKEIES